MLVIMAVLPFSMYAQEGKKKTKPVERYWYIQADGGLSINHGDLANYEGGVWNDFKHFWNNGEAIKNWNAHFGVGYQFGKVVGLNLKGGYGLLAGHKHGQPLAFIDVPAKAYLTDLALDKTNYIEGNLNLTLNLFNMFKYNPRRVINLVPHVGIGGIYYKAGAIYQLDENDKPAETPLADQKDKRELTFTVPVGMEITFNIAPKFDLFLDYTYLFTGSDKLDQMMKKYKEGYYTEENRVINDKDMYSQFNLGLRVKFNNPCDIEKMARESKKITYRVNPDPLVEGEDGKVCFDVIVTVPAEYFEKQAVMNLKPYLAYKGGQIDLDPITFVGEKVKGEGDFRVNYKEGGEFTKHYCKDYVPEMENCELKGDPMFYVYEGTIYPTQEEIVNNTYFTQGSTVKLADGVIPQPKKVDPVYDTVWETVDKEVAVKKLTYFFNKDKYNIADRRKLNNEADAAFKDLMKAGVTNFEIRAWASPEGEEGHNNELSNNRCGAADKQMKKLAKKTAVEINGKGYGPDWNTFVELVAASDLKDKDAIVNNINKSSNKEQTIREMCDIYPQLEKDILPQIRRAEVYTTETVQEKVMKLVERK
jgi:outer membrane protein OmpA-like peptidoglycan-associated protein/opacity protein-like surface antigen